MPAAGALFALLFVAVILGTIGLWYAISSETADQPRMSRGDAERVARQDTGDDGPAATDDTEDSDDWGSDAEWGVENSDDRR